MSSTTRDIVVRGVADWPESGPFVGREAVLRQWARLREAWDDVQVTYPSGFIDHGDRVAGRLGVRGRGRGPEFVIEQTVTVREGLIAAIDFFWDHAQALDAMGLSDEDARAESS